MCTLAAPGGALGHIAAQQQPGVSRLVLMTRIRELSLFKLGADGQVKKRCNKCRRFKLLSAFNKNKLCRGGCMSACKACTAKYYAKWYAENAARKRERTAKYYRENREEILVQAAVKYTEDAVFRSNKRRYSAARLKTPEGQIASAVARIKRRTRTALAGPITSDALRKVLSATRCEYCKIPFVKQKHHPQYLTVDHRIPLCRGGSNEQSNLAAACLRCNTRKHAKTDTEFLAYMRKYR